MNEQPQARPIHCVLAEMSNLSQLADAARQRQQLTEVVKSVTQPRLAPYYEVVDLQNRTLIIHTQTAAVATALRYNQNSILSSLKQLMGLSAVNTVAIKVRPTSTKRSSKRPPRQFVPTEAAALLTATAESVNCTQLTDSLRRLAGRIENAAP